MQLPPPGDYVAKLNARMVVYEAKSQALCIAIPCIISQGDHTGFTTKATVTLVKSDGTVMTNGLENLKTIFGWDGLDPFALMDSDYKDIEFALAECKHENGEDSKTYFKAGWVNALGGGMKMPEAADRRSVLAKYGSKFRALAGGAAVKPAAPKAAVPALPKPAPAAPTGPAATMEEAWEACCKNNVGNEEPSWFAAMASMFPGKTNTNLTPQDWGRLKAHFSDNVPV
jgi:hypothetical protein